MASSLETGDLSLETAGYEPGIKRYSVRYGPFEERTLLIDSEALILWAGEDGEADDVMRIDGPLEIGDLVVGGFSEALTAGGVAGAIYDVGVEGLTATCIVNEGDADAAASVLKAGLSATTEPFNMVNTAESFVDMTVSAQAMMVEATPGRWKITYYLFKGSESRRTYEQYTGDPNVMPQNAVTAEA